MMMAGVAELSPMEMAVGQRDNEMIRALVRSGLDVNEPNREGLTALSWAAMMGLPNQVQALIALGADVNHADTFGMTPLLWASLIDMGNHGSIEALLKAGADPRARTKTGESALALAKKWQQPDVTRILKQAGVAE
jgi:ankyrin repeat protein